MVKKYDRPDFQKAIFDIMNRYIYKVTLEGELVFEKTKEELAQALGVSQPTLKKYLEVWARIKNRPYRFFDAKRDTLGKFTQPPLNTRNN